MAIDQGTSCRTQGHDDTKPSAHWDPPNSPFRTLFRILAVISWGRPTLDHTWKMVHSKADSGRDWEDGRDRVRNKLSTTVVTSGLLLTTTAVFMTTTPPVHSALNYTSLGPYICMLVAFGLSLGGLIVGSAVIYALTSSSRDWFCNTICRTHSRIWCIMIIIAYPFLAVGIATLTCAVGLVIAATSSKVKFISIGSIFVLLLPVMAIPLFVWIIIPGPKPHEAKTDVEAVGKLTDG